MAEIKGLRQALDNLRRFPEHVSPQGGGPINRALFKAAKPWQDHASDNASSLGPGNHRRGSGSSAYSIVGRLKDNIVRRRDPEPERDGFYARVFVTYAPRVYWGYFVELGTEKQGAQPFLRPAIDQAGNKPIEIFRRALSRDIDRIAKRLKK
jgi:HK97 gp10 family phage protein